MLQESSLLHSFPLLAHLWGPRFMLTRFLCLQPFDCFPTTSPFGSPHFSPTVLNSQTSQSNSQFT